MATNDWFGFTEQQMDEDPVTAVMVLIAALDVRNIKDLPGCWEHTIDDQWFVAINSQRVDTACSTGIPIPPFCLYVEFNGWPAGLLSFADSGEFAAGEAANPVTFAEAIRAVASRLGNGEVRS